MSNKEFFLKTLEAETPIFERVFKAIPFENLEYKPDPKSKTAMELSRMMTGEITMLSMLADTGVVDVAQEAGDASLNDFLAIASAFVAGAHTLKAKLTEMSDEKWETGSAKMTMGEKAVWEDTLHGMTWGFLLDLIHHRGQISTYIRAMGGKVPSIYGPSADSGM